MTHTIQTPATSLHSTLDTPFVRVPAVAALALAFARVVITWDRNRRTRNHLKNMDDHLLKDIGVTARQAHKEARRPFWL